MHLYTKNQFLGSIDVLNHLYVPHLLSFETIITISQSQSLACLKGKLDYKLNNASRWDTYDARAVAQTICQETKCRQEQFVTGMNCLTMILHHWPPTRFTLPITATKMFTNSIGDMADFFFVENTYLIKELGLLRLQYVIYFMKKLWEKEMSCLNVTKWLNILLSPNVHSVGTNRPRIYFVWSTQHSLTFNDMP